MHRIAATVAVGLSLIALAILLTLTGAPASVATASSSKHELIFTTREKTEACQGGEVLPLHTRAVRLRVWASVGPPVALDILAHGRLISHGESEAGWTGGVVTIPVTPLSHTVSHTTLCFALLLNGGEAAYLYGEFTDQAHAASARGGLLPGRITAEYLRPGRSSWFSLVPGVVRRMGFGHALTGVSGVVIALLLMSAVVALCTRLTIRELR